MKRNSITIKYSVHINRPREAVWDYTQDYRNRSAWDSSVISAVTLANSPKRTVKIVAKGNIEMIFVYKLDDRPNKTTLSTQSVKSPIIESAGGSWQYVDEGNGTLWSQTNTIVFKKSFFLPLLLPIYKWAFQSQTQKAMNKARKILERSTGKS